MLVRLGWVLLLGSLPLVRSAPIHIVEPTLATPTAVGRVTVWTDREDPYQRGQGARVFLTTAQSAHVAVFRVDTDGQVRILFPREPWSDTYVRERRVLEVSGPRGRRSFMVDDYPGVGYIFAIASTEPFDFDDITRGDYWDYRLIDGGRIQRDPYVALTDLAQRIAPGGDYDYDVAPYYVERRYDYPRFVCYDCHAYASYNDWDPYRTVCSRYRVVIYDDPRYYPYRYNRGRNVVAARPPHPGPRYVFRDADREGEYVTRRRLHPEADERRTLQRGRTSQDIGGRGVVPTPGPDGLGRRLRETPEISPARPLVPERRQPEAHQPERRRPERRGEARAPQSTGEPELRRRRP
jgi:hypothetical protein